MSELLSVLSHHLTGVRGGLNDEVKASSSGALWGWSSRGSYYSLPRPRNTNYLYFSLQHFMYPVKILTYCPLEICEKVINQALHNQQSPCFMINFPLMLYSLSFPASSCQQIDVIDAKSLRKMCGKRTLKGPDSVDFSPLPP